MLRLCYRDERLSQEIGAADFDQLVALADAEDPPRQSLEFLSTILDRLRCTMLVICLDDTPATIEPEALFMRLDQAVNPRLQLYLRIAYASPPPKPFEGWARSSRQSAPRNTRGVHLLDLSWVKKDLRSLFNNRVSRASNIFECRDLVLGAIGSPSDLETWIAVFDDDQYRDGIDAALWQKLYNAMHRARERRPDRNIYGWTLDDWKQARMILAQEGATPLARMAISSGCLTLLRAWAAIGSICGRSSAICPRRSISCSPTPAARLWCSPTRAVG